ncbi:hypothetical protein JTE90_000731 [Oedothorax gibbosus]|uniref:Uncharacterized protein n=1 Tax=Oedothorax gibbosus TaxID=931172 RepID=A0AAV6UPQ6_9ARAC|nr:hypothetical protein JTE90_000731 [Oedothorax gibbosus]
MKMDLNPARGGSDILAVVLGSPPFHKRGADCAHFGQLIHRLEAVVYCICKQVGEFLGREITETLDIMKFHASASLY